MWMKRPNSRGFRSPPNDPIDGGGREQQTPGRHPLGGLPQLRRIRCPLQDRSLWSDPFQLALQLLSYDAAGTLVVMPSRTFRLFTPNEPDGSIDGTSGPWPSRKRPGGVHPDRAVGVNPGATEQDPRDSSQGREWERLRLPTASTPP